MLVLTAFARRFPIPYPIFLVLGGLGLSFVPRVPVVHLDPELVFLIFLPPMLWSAAYFTSLRDFRANLRSIMLLAVGRVVVTTVAVAPPPSPGSFASPTGWSPCSKAKAWSTTRRRWCSTAWRWPPPSPAAS